MNVQLAYPPRLMSRDQAAHYLSISTRTLDYLQDQGHITPKKLGKTRKYLRQDLDEYAANLKDWGADA